MFKTYFRLQSKLSTAPLAAITLLSLLFNLWATKLLNSAYAASAFPVPYWEAHLSFSHEKLKLWYGFLLRNGTFEQYVHTQNIDFLFIASVLLLHMAALLLVSRLAPAHSAARKLLVGAALLSAIAPLADAFENGISYVMLANPTTFEPALALAYSSVAALKFTVFTAAYIAAAGGLLAALVGRCTRLRKRASAA